MLVKNNDEYRNLVEQVLKNKEDIARHYEIDRAMANLGIKVVGQVTSANDLPDASTYQGEYGDTYAVGDKTEVDAGTASYDYYVWTRPDPNAGELNSYWLNVGKISVVGPQGVQGIQGIQGPKGDATEIIVFPPNAYMGGSAYPVGTIGITFPGLIYVTEIVNGVKRWVYKYSIRGSQGLQGPQGPRGYQGLQGPQGIQGPRGDVGGIVNIIDELTSESLLPQPATLNNITAAYLVDHEGQNHQDLWIQIGETPATAYWKNTGPFNAATLVTVNGVGTNLWDSDTKVDKSSVPNIIYGTDAQGNTVAIDKSQIGGGNLYMHQIRLRFDVGSIGYNAYVTIRNTRSRGYDYDYVYLSDSQELLSQLKNSIMMIVDASAGVGGTMCIFGYDKDGSPSTYTASGYKIRDNNYAEYNLNYAEIREDIVIQI